VDEVFDVFVSYGHTDAVWVTALAENLEAEGLRVFLDDWEIVAGDRWVARLEAGIASSGAGLVVCSAASLSRPWVRAEYEALLVRSETDGLRLVPVLVERVDLPAFLGTRDYVDFSRVDGDPAAYRAAFDRLVRGLKEERGPRVSGTPGPDGLVVPGTGAWRPEGPAEAVLRVSSGEVVFAPVGGDLVRAPAPQAVDRRLQDALFKLRLARRAAPRLAAASERATGEAVAGPSAGLSARLVEVGRLLGERFASGPVGDAVAASVTAAVAAGASLRLAVEVDVAGLDDLPWETLTVPGVAGPLVLHPNVALHQSVPGLGPMPLAAVPGPLRILVVVANPERESGADLLDYERELGKVLDSVDGARRSGGAYVEVLEWGSLNRVREALRRQRFHVLHLSCHAQPGRLMLETDDGSADLVTAQRFAEQALPKDEVVPLVVLAGCSTANTPDKAETDADEALPGLARGLLARGVPAVLAMTAAVTDRYATDLAAALYRELASGRVADPLAALAHARRTLETARLAAPPGDSWAGLAEWATPTLFLRGPARPLLTPDSPVDPITAPADPPPLADGVVVRAVGEFVGRRAELRRILARLRSTRPAVVVRGIGGVGKSTLAAHAVGLLGSDVGIVVSVRGQVAPELLLDRLANRLRSLALRQPAGRQQAVNQLGAFAADTALPWAQRLELLAEHLLPTVPVLLLLDNFEDNQIGPTSGDPQLTDPHLAAFLACWVRVHRHARLLVTSRYPLVLPHDVHRGVVDDLHLGPLSWAEARKLAWRLPALDQLAPGQLVRAVADVGGHPRALEYLDALLAGGKARFDDVDRRLRHAVGSRADVNDPDGWLADHAGQLDRALAETAALAASDVLLDALLARLDSQPLARQLLLGAAVYRLPIDLTGLAWQIAGPADHAGSTSDARLQEISGRLVKLRAADPDAALAGLDLTSEERRQLGEDLAARRRPPLADAAGLPTAVDLLDDLGLLGPATLPDGGVGRIVHRWTATALAGRTTRDHLTDAHQRAAAHWTWRVRVLPQPRSDDVTQLLEAAHHHLVVGDHNAAAESTIAAYRQLEIWGAYDWAEQICTELLAAVPLDSQAAGAMCFNLGNLAQRRGNWPVARSQYEQAVAIWELHADRRRLAAGYNNLGNLDQLRGEYPSAEARYRQALAINEEIGDRAGLAFSYTNLGNLAELRGDYPTAEGLYQQALTIREDGGDHARLAATYTDLGILADLRGDYRTAEAHHQQALTIREKLHDRDGIATSYGNLGNVALRQGNYPTADDFYRKALTIQQELGDRAAIASIYANLGNLRTSQGQPTEGVPLTLAALVGLLQLGSPDAATALWELRRQREILGPEMFHGIAQQHLDADSLNNLLGMLDDLAAMETEPRPASDT
jgi:tetratricopeptide (TPR) repeat protein